MNLHKTFLRRMAAVAPVQARWVGEAFVALYANAHCR